MPQPGRLKLSQILCLLCVLLMFPALTPVRAGAVASPVQVLKVDGPIAPVVADYVDRGIGMAEEAGAVCVIELNTPGGLYETTQKIVTRIINARVPVVVYVSPAGGWAASAGTFITLSAHVAAMAPGSRLGAAHPVAVGTGGGELPPTQAEKITQDAAAWARSIAQMRGRNPVEAELAVKESKSYSVTEALDAGLVDLRASNLNDLFAQINGHKVSLTGGGEVELRTGTGAVSHKPMSWVERLLVAVSDPNVAYLLLTIGLLGITVELFHPGAILPGVLGGVSLLLSLYALGTMDAYWGGLLFIVLAFVLFVAEAFIISHGLLAAGGIISFVLGSLMLFSSHSPYLQISLGLIAGVAIGLTGFLVLIIGAVVRGQKRQVTTGREAILGGAGRTLTDLSPEGIILFEGEHWQARAEEEGRIEAGVPVTVTGMEGLKLRVKRKVDRQP